MRKVDQILGLIKAEINEVGVLTKEEVESIISDYNLDNESYDELKELIDNSISSITYKDDEISEEQINRIFFNEYKYVEDIIERYDENNYRRIRNGKSPIYILVDLIKDNGVHYSFVKNYGLIDEEDFDWF